MLSIVHGVDDAVLPWWLPAKRKLSYNFYTDPNSWKTFNLLIFLRLLMLAR